MGVKIKRHCPDYFVTDGDNEIPVEFEPIDGTEVVKYTEDGKRAVVGYLCQDEDPSNPRKEWDNFGTMVCWHRRYDLGDEQPDMSPQPYIRSLAAEYTDRDTDEMEMDAVWKIIHKHYVFLPLFLYDHSGITMSTSSFSCPWDSGQVGWIYASYEAIRKEWSRKHVTKKLIQKVEEVLRSEVEVYDQYLTGDVYGVCVNAAINISKDPEEPDWIRADERGVVGYSSDGTSINGNVWEDACWGYYGHEYAKEERDNQIADMLIQLEEVKITTPDDPDQPDLSLEGGGQNAERTQEG